MKSFLSFFVILLLFQSLFFGSMVKLELPEVHTDKWDLPLIHNQNVLDPFLISGKELIDQNLQYKNEWLPFHFNNTSMIRNTTAFTMASEILFKQELRNNFNTIPVFIMNGTLRI